MTQQDEDKKKMLLALAVGVGSTAKTYEELTEDEIREAVALYKAKGLDKRVESGVTLTEQETQALVATALMDTYEYFKVVNLDDERTCQACKEWIGRILTIHGEDPRYKTVDDFIRSGGLHPNCRCTLQRATVKKPSTKELTQMAQNAEPIGDQPVYRGFVDADLDKDIQYNFDETLVMLTPVGKFVGSAPDGTPTTEIVDEQSIQQMA